MRNLVGERVRPPGLGDEGLADYFEDARPSEPLPELSEREREILDLIAGGLKNPEIALRLYRNPKTIRSHVSNILHKLQVTDRA